MLEGKRITQKQLKKVQNTNTEAINFEVWSGSHINFIVSDVFEYFISENQYLSLGAILRAAFDAPK